MIIVYTHTQAAGLDYLRESSLIIITANSEFFTRRRRTGTGNNQISAAAAIRPCPKQKQGRENGFKTRIMKRAIFSWVGRPVIKFSSADNNSEPPPPPKKNSSITTIFYLHSFFFKRGKNRSKWELLTYINKLHVIIDAGCQIVWAINDNKSRCTIVQLLISVDDIEEHHYNYQVSCLVWAFGVVKCITCHDKVVFMNKNKKKTWHI